MANRSPQRVHHPDKRGVAVWAALLLITLLLLLPSTALATEGKVKVKPKKQATEQVERQEPQTHFFGYRPIEQEIKSIHDANDGGYDEDVLVPMASLPSSYKSSNVGVLTPLKDQNPFGTCWTLSVMAASESSIMSKGQLMQGTVPDLSERQLAFFTYNPVNDPLGNLDGDSTIPSSFYLDLGGNERLAAYTLSSWSGAASESSAPYSELVTAYENKESHSSFLGATALQSALSRGSDVAHLTDVRQIPMYDRDDVKQAIMEYGAVDASLLYDDSFYNYDTNSLYNGEIESTNHAIALVGWDDNYAKENFNGATFRIPEGEYQLPTEYRDLGLGETATINGPEAGQNWLAFIPTKSGYYEFLSSENDGDPYATLYVLDEAKGSLVELSSDDDGGDDGNFVIGEYLTEGATYYLFCRSYSGSASLSGAGQPCLVVELA